MMTSFYSVIANLAFFIPVLILAIINSTSVLTSRLFKLIAKFIKNLSVLLNNNLYL